MTRTQMQHIPYKGSGPMIPDLLAVPRLGAVVRESGATVD